MNLGATFRPDSPLGGMAAKDAQVHELQRLFRRTALGSVLDDFFTSQMPRFDRALMRDEEAFGLLMVLVQPWLELKTNYEILSHEIDERTVALLKELVARIVEFEPILGDRLQALVDLVKDHQGRPLRDLLEADIPRAFVASSSSN